MLLGADPEALDELATRYEVCAAHLARLRTRLRSLDPAAWRGPAAERWWSRVEVDLVQPMVLAGGECARSARRLRARARAQRQASLPDPDRTTLLIDRRGDGRWVARTGDPEAELVVVLVPGVGTDLGDIRRLGEDAERLWRVLAAHATGPAPADAAALTGVAASSGVAVVSWLDYDPPDHVLAALDRGPAQQGAVRLARTVEQLRRAGAERVVVVGHSYGALVAAHASAAGMASDELVLLGAPGLGVAAPGELGLVPGADLWVAEARGDPVVALARTLRVHGPDPAPHGLALPTSLDGHSGYLRDPVLLDALARLALDDRAEVRQPVPSSHRLPEGQRWDSTSRPTRASPRS